MRSGCGLVNHNNNNIQAKEEDDEMFGTARSYTASFRNRPTMISAKYRQKEERRKVLKISINKLKKIEDPESSLRRSVLINNTMRKLQRESREEKLVKQQSYRCFSTDLFREDENMVDPLNPTPTSPLRTESNLVDITNLPASGAKTSAKEESLGCDESMDAVDSLITPEEGTPSARPRKRSFDEVDDCDVQDVLSQFYLPPTPRLTSLDEDDEEVDVVDLEEKRPRLDGPCQSAADRLREAPAPERRFGDGYSCGHSSIFNELQSVVYHSLIASLET